MLCLISCRITHLHYTLISNCFFNFLSKLPGPGYDVLFVPVVITKLTFPTHFATKHHFVEQINFVLIGVFLNVLFNPFVDCLFFRNPVFFTLFIVPPAVTTTIKR